MKLGKLVFVSKKGSSLVNVLIVITILLILSSGLLLITRKNSQFSKGIISKSNDYYDLECVAEQKLKEIDKEIEKSERDTLKYMKDGGYKNPGVYKSTEGDNTIDSGKQSYFNKEYKKYIADKRGLDNFLAETFGKVYYINLQKQFNDVKPEPIKDVGNKKITVDFHAEADKKYAEIVGSTAWVEFKAEEGDTVFKITVTDNNGKMLKVVAKSKVPVYDTTRIKTLTEGLKGNPIWTNAITAKGSIKFLDCTTRIQGDLFSSDNKPNMTTAITRGNQEGILAEDSEVNIYGNVYSRGDFHVSSKTKKSVVDVYKYGDSKNMRCKGFILSNESYYDESILKGVNTSINFNDTPISRYTEEGKDNTFPFIFKDNTGGNVYCNDLSVENSALEESGISIAGNVSTNGSVINDSLYGKTKIELKGAYVGLTSVTGDDRYNQNKGSCIVNNIYNTKDNLDQMNKIVLTDRLIVPGVNFIDESGKNKYKTGESITCNFWDKDTMLNSYIKKDGEKGGNVYLNFRTVKTENGKKSLVITPEKKLMSNINQDQNELYKLFLEKVYKGDDTEPSGNAGDFITNIYMPDKYSEKKINGYCEGAAVIVEEKIHRLYLHPMDLSLGYGWNDHIIEKYDDNKTTYERLEGILKRIFESKTINFGTANKNFDNSVDVAKITGESEDETGIKVLNGGGEVNISGEQKKIIYSQGDLTITGKGTLRGTIICTGNVTIKGKVDVIYDEEFITKAIKNNEAVRNFFKPGEAGNYCMTKESVNLTSMEKKSTDTYKIVEWKEDVKK